MRRERVLFWVFAVVALGAAPGRASAEAQLQAGLSISGGYTDNVLSAPTNPQPGIRGPEADSFADVRPGLALTFGTPRALVRLANVFSANLFVEHSEANSYSDRLEWAGFFRPGKTTELLLSAGGTYGRLNTFNTLVAPAQTMVGVLPQGGTTFFGGTFQETLGWDLAPVWRATQGVTFTSFVPIDSQNPQPVSTSTELGFAVDRYFARDTIGPQLLETVVVDGDVTFGGMTTPGQQQILSLAQGRWRHDFGHFFSSQLDAGIIFVTRADDLTGLVWQPAATAALRYSRPDGRAELLYAHTAQPNVFVGQSFVVDQVTLRASLPLGRQVTIGVGAGFQHGRQVDVQAGQLATPVDVVVTDASVGWRPSGAPFELGIRYELFDQMGESGVGQTPSILRNVVLLTASAVYPGQRTGLQVPDKLSQRADRDDELPELRDKRPPTEE